MKPITTTLAELRGGLAVEEIGEAMREATSRVRETGKKAKVIIALTISPNGAADPGDVQSVFVDDDITLKLPTAKKRASVFFLNEHDDLLRQQTIPGIEPEAAGASETTPSGRDRAAGKD